MDGSGSKPAEGAEAMVLDLTYSWLGGGVPLDLRELLQCGGSGNSPIWSGGPGRFPKDC